MFQIQIDQHLFLDQAQMNHFPIYETPEVHLMIPFHFYEDVLARVY